MRVTDAYYREAAKGYPDQPRDTAGRWTSAGRGVAGSAARISTATNENEPYHISEEDTIPPTTLAIRRFDFKNDLADLFPIRKMDAVNKPDGTAKTPSHRAAQQREIRDTMHKRLDHLLHGTGNAGADTQSVTFSPTLSQIQAHSRYPDRDTWTDKATTFRNRWTGRGGPMAPFMANRPTPRQLHAWLDELMKEQFHALPKTKKALTEEYFRSLELKAYDEDQARDKHGRWSKEPGRVPAYEGWMRDQADKPEPPKPRAADLPAEDRMQMSFAKVREFAAATPLVETPGPLQAHMFVDNPTEERKRITDYINYLMAAAHAELTKTAWPKPPAWAVTGSHPDMIKADDNTRDMVDDFKTLMHTYYAPRDMIREQFVHHWSKLAAHWRTPDAKGYPDQPRDWAGRWTSGAATSLLERAAGIPKRPPGVQLQSDPPPKFNPPPTEKELAEQRKWETLTSVPNLPRKLVHGVMSSDNPARALDDIAGDIVDNAYWKLATKGSMDRTAGQVLADKFTGRDNIPFRGITDERYNIFQNYVTRSTKREWGDDVKHRNSINSPSNEHLNRFQPGHDDERKLRGTVDDIADYLERETRKGTDPKTIRDDLITDLRRRYQMARYRDFEDYLSAGDYTKAIGILALSVLGASQQMRFKETGDSSVFNNLYPARDLDMTHKIADQIEANRGSEGRLLNQWAANEADAAVLNKLGLTMDEVRAIHASTMTTATATDFVQQYGKNLEAYRMAKAAQDAAKGPATLKSLKAAGAMIALGAVMEAFGGGIMEAVKGDDALANPLSDIHYPGSPTFRQAQYKINPHYRDDPTHDPDQARDAKEAELLQIRGLGPALANAILNEYDANGPFSSLQDLRDRVSGIGPQTMQKLGPFLDLPDNGNRDRRKPKPRPKKEMTDAYQRFVWRERYAIS